MRQTAKTESAQSKMRIQALLREIGLKRQKGKCFFEGKEVHGEVHRCTSWYQDKTLEWKLVLQADHLHSRRFNVSYANPDLILVICKGLHGWKKWNEEAYNQAARKYIGPKRRKLWDAVKADRKVYSMTAWDWAKEEIALKEKLKSLTT